MIVSLQSTDDETDRSYYLTQKDGRLFLENEEEEGMGITEMELYQIFDDFFRKEL